MKINSDIVSEYKVKHELYKKFTEYLYEKIDLNLKKDKIIFDRCTSRTKEIRSLVDKIERKKNKYANLDEIADLSGIRIVLLHTLNISKIEELLAREFEIIDGSVRDHSKKNFPNEFGYEGLHYIIKLRKEDELFVDRRLFSGLKAEVQVRTILQHAWDSISHNYIYKKEDEIPKKLQRSFNAISAGLIVFDDAFIRFIKDLGSTREEYNRYIKKGEYNIDINKISLEEYFKNGQIFNEIYSKMRNIFTSHYIDKLEDIGITNNTHKNQNGIIYNVYSININCGQFISCLADLSITTIKQLDLALKGIKNNSIDDKFLQDMIMLIKNKQRYFEEYDDINRKYLLILLLIFYFKKNLDKKPVNEILRFYKDKKLFYESKNHINCTDLKVDLEDDKFWGMSKKDSNLFEGNAGK